MSTLGAFTVNGRQLYPSNTTNRTNNTGIPGMLSLGDLFGGRSFQPPPPASRAPTTTGGGANQPIVNGGGQTVATITPAPPIGGGGSQYPRMVDQAAAAAWQDVQNAQTIERLNRERNEGVINDFAGRLPDYTNQRLGSLADADRLLGGDVTRLREQGGDDLATFDRNAADTIRTADRYAEGAVTSAEQTIKKFEDRRAQDMASAMVSLRSRMRDEEEMSGVNPDGTMKSLAQIESEKSQRNQQYRNEIAMTQTRIASEYNNTLAQIRALLPTVQLQAGSLASGTRKDLTIGRLSAEQGRRDYETLASGLNQVRAQLKTSGLASALQDEMNGRMAVADWKFNNPYSVVSTFGALMQLAALNTAPGAQNIAGYNPATGRSFPTSASPTPYRNVVIS